jgi:hypothetical protein
MKPYQITYAIATGNFPEPARFCGNRVFTTSDIQCLAEFFGVEAAVETEQKGGPCTSTNT